MAVGLIEAVDTPGIYVTMLDIHCRRRISRIPTYTFHHIHLASPDPEKTAEFYEKTFGAKKSIVDLGGGRKVVSVDLNGTPILIRAKAEGEAEKPSLDHFGIRTDNLEKAVAELKGQGVKFTQEITQLRPNVKISFLRTPDDVSIELLQAQQ